MHQQHGSGTGWEGARPTAGRSRGTGRPLPGAFSGRGAQSSPGVPPAPRPHCSAPRLAAAVARPHAHGPHASTLSQGLVLTRRGGSVPGTGEDEEADAISGSLPSPAATGTAHLRGAAVRALGKHRLGASQHAPLSVGCDTGTEPTARGRGRGGSEQPGPGPHPAPAPGGTPPLKPQPRSSPLRDARGTAQGWMRCPGQTDSPRWDGQTPAGRSEPQPPAQGRSRPSSALPTAA